MFSPISVGAYLIQRMTGGEDAEGEEDAKREDSNERNSHSGSDSDEGTSADTPGPRVPVNRALTLEEIDCPIIESEIISSDTANTEYSFKQDEFTARLAVLPEADIAVDDKMTSSEDRVQDYMADRGGLPNDFHTSEDTVPQDINTHTLHVNENRDNERPSQSGLQENDTTRDGPINTPLSDGYPTDFSETALYEQSELHIDSDPDSGSDSSTTSGETMSTVKENTENRDFEDAGDVNEYNEKNNELYAKDHVYIAPDLEFPFHKSTVQLKDPVDIETILDNMEKKIAQGPQKPQEERHIPKPITDDELENALKILRSGRPPAQRSWYSLDNISKPNRTFALYYTNAEARRRRNSAGDEDDCISLPEKNSILGFPERPDEHSALYYVNDQWKFDDLHIADTPSEEEFALPGSTNATEIVPMGAIGSNPQHPLELTLKSDEEVQPLPPSEVDKNPIHKYVQERPQISQLSDQKTISKTTMKSAPVDYSTPFPEMSVSPSETSLNAKPHNVPHGSVHPVRAAVYPVTERPTFLVQTRANDESVDPKQENSSSVSDEYPVSPKPYIAAVVKYPQTFHPPIAPKHKFSKHNIEETEQYPVLSMKQKEIEFAEFENILPEKQKYPPLPPKPSFLKKQVEKENPIAPSLITQEKSCADLSVFEAKTSNDKNQDELPMSPEPYISASVKHQNVFSLPSLGTPISMKVQPTYRGTVIVDKQYPVISIAQKELVMSELENLIPKQKVPPKVPPKPSFRKRVEVDEEPAVSTKVQAVQSSIDLSILEKREPSTLPGRVPQMVTADAGEENTNEDEVVIIQAGISVYRQKSHEELPRVPEPLQTRSSSLQISDIGEVSFVNPVAKDEHKTEPSTLRESTTARVTRMSASLSLHRLESGEHLTETVLSIHENEDEDVEDQTTESENKESPIGILDANEDKEDLNRLTDSERDGRRSGTEDSYQSSGSLPLSAESFHGTRIPPAASVSDHFGSSSCSSPDEFLTVADITISKMEAAKNTHNLGGASSTSSSSDSDSSGSADSDDSSFESAEEHTYVVTECEDVFDSHYDEGHRSSLPQVIEEVDEEEEEDDEEEEEEEESGKSTDEGTSDNMHEFKQGIKTDFLPEEGTHDTEQRGEENNPNKTDLRVSPTPQREQPFELTDTQNLDNIPVAVQRYPRYISMGKPDIKPHTDEHALSKTVDLESLSQPKQSWAYPNENVAEKALSDEEDTSSGNDELRNKSESDKDANDESENSEEMEEDFSEEYSDEPEWQPPPPSSGARVFVLTANMFRPTRVEPQADETRDVKHISDVPQERTGNAGRDDAFERDVKYIDDKEYRDYEEELHKMVDQNHHELEPDRYFKPISEVMPSASESIVQEKPTPVTVSNNPNRNSGNISQHGEPDNNSKDVKSVTVTYTVIHTRKTPTLGEIPSSPSEPRYENFPVRNKDIDESTPEYEPYNNETNSISAGPQQSTMTVESGKPEGNGTNDSNVGPLSNDNVPKHESRFDKFDETTAKKELNSSQDTSPDDHLKSSRFIPVHEVGPYNYTSSEPKEHKPGNRETIVRKTELNSGVSVFSVSSREHRPQKQHSTQADDRAEHEDSGPYRFGSWYEEPTQDVPAMAIALVKRDIKLPSDHLSGRETVVKPKPKPEPKVEPVVVNTKPTSPESLKEGPYRYSAWYEDPTEEKEESNDDVVVISSYAANDPNSPKKETPLSPVREPGSYTYSSWYEDPVDKPSEDNFFILSTPVASDEKSGSDTSNSKKKSSDDTRSRERYRPSDLYDDQPENIEEPPEEDTFVISKPFTETSQPSRKPDSNTTKSKTTDSREMQYEAQYRFSTWYDEKPASNEPTDTFTISRAIEKTTRSVPDEKTRDSRESQFAGQYLYSTWSESTSPKEQSETFTISRPEEDTRPLTSGSGDDLYYPRETTSRTDLLATDPTGRKSSAGDSVSGSSSRKNSNCSSRTSGSLADVSATSGEAMRRTWSDDSENISGDDSRGIGSQNFALAPAPAGRMNAVQPPQPKPRLSKPSAPSSSDDEQQIKPRRQGRGEGKGQETPRNADEILSPKAEYALASSAWRQIPVGGSFQPTSESVVWDSGDDSRMTRRHRGDHNSRYSVTDKSRREIENMLDSLVPDEELQEDTSNVSCNIRGDHSVVPPQHINKSHGSTSLRSQDSSRSYNVLPQAANEQTSFKETRTYFTSEPHISYTANAAMDQEPDFPEPILAALPQRDEPATTYPSNRLGRQNVPGEVRNVAPLSSRDEYKLAAASWENLSSASDNGTFARAKMETWDNDPGAVSAQQKVHSLPLAGRHRFQSAEPAPNLPEEASVPPRGPKRNGLVIAADIHAPYAQPEPATPHLAVHMLSTSSSTAELAPPPPKDWGAPRKAHSAVGINQPLPKKPVSKSVIPDAEAVVHRHRHRPPVKGLRPPPSDARSGRPSSPVSISSYSSTQSLPARILPRLPRENELEKLKHQLALISKQIEIKTGELKQINLLNPSIKYHIPIRGRRGELISPDGRILSTPEAPNKRELDKYKKFFDRLPEPDFRRLMHEILVFKNKVRHKEEEIKRLTNQCTGLRKRLLWLAHHEK